MKKAFLFVFLQLAMFSVFAQEGFVKGYIINYKGDTVKGKILDRKYYNSVNSWQKIKFINDKGEKEKLSADELRGYVKNDTIVYQTLTLGVEEKKRFVAKQENGAVILFVDIKGEAPSKVQVNPSPFGIGLFVTLRIGGKTQNIEGEYYLQKRNDPNSLMEWRDRDYKRTAAYFFKEDKELMKSIESDAFQFSDLQTIVRTYNEWKIKQ